MESSLTSGYTGYAHVDTMEDESEPKPTPLEPSFSLVTPPPRTSTVPTIKVYSVSNRTLTISSRRSIESRESETDNDESRQDEDDDRIRILPFGAAPARIPGRSEKL